MTRTMTASRVKTTFYKLLKGVHNREDEVVVTKDGEPTAVLISYQEFVQLMETIEVLSDPVAMKRIRQARAYLKKGGKLLRHEDIFGEPL